LGPLGELQLGERHLGRRFYRLAREPDLRDDLVVSRYLSRAPGDGHPFTGRIAELETLIEVWRRARAGHGGIAALSGEGGIGKTRIAAKLIETARAGGAAVAWCAGLDLGVGAPFGLWAELLRGLVRIHGGPPEALPWVADLARLSPELEVALGPAPVPAHSPSPQLERVRLYEAMVAMLEWAAASSGRRPGSRRCCCSTTSTARIPPASTRRVGDAIGVDWSRFDLEQFRIGMDVEFEHGSHDPQTDVTHDDPIVTGRIALAHMKEFPDYYERLARMEHEAERDWSKKSG
jgi:hypothetical protein